MSDLRDLNTGEARLGRLLLRLALAFAWASVAWIVYTKGEQFNISPTMQYAISGFAGIMTIISGLQAFERKPKVKSTKRDLK